tara:strand:+ start:510 stop:1133 length:624 start_codon:yes stop_codon:yes gene_type:complete
MVQQLVKTYLKKDIPEIIEDLERYRNDVILKDENNKLQINYTKERLDFLDQVAVSVVYTTELDVGKINQEISSISTLWHTPAYLNCSRCLNRLYISPNFKKDFKGAMGIKRDNRLRHTTIEMIKQQSELCKTDYVFISREYPGARWVKTISDYIGWYNPEGMYKVADGVGASNWQYIIIKRVKETPFDATILRRGMTEIEWKRTFLG